MLTAITDFFRNLLTSNDFMPHGHCYLWRPEIVWLHAVPDTLTALAYYSIPCALVYFVCKRKDLVFSWIFLMFGVFILACGTTHIMDVVTLWNPVYRLDALIRVFTAAVSVLTAAILWPLIPKALTLPSPAQLKRVNEEMAAEISQRIRAEDSLRQSQATLEQHVIERTTELSKVNDALKIEIGRREQIEKKILTEKTELSNLNEIMAGREERIIELKTEVNEMLRQAGQPPKYEVTRQ